MGKQGVIYKIENLANGKVYIGQTIQSFNRRKRTHENELRNNKHKNLKLQNAWKKYGSESFKFNIIEVCEESMLDQKEIYYIQQYDSFKRGYNMTVGGKQVMQCRNHSIETRVKIGEIQKKNWMDTEYKKLMMNRPVYYRNQSPRATKIICINDQKVFSSMIEAGEYYGIGLKKVSSVCTGKNEYAGLEETGRKLQFAYYEEGKVYTLKNINHVNEKKKVKCLTTGEVFNSIREAGVKTGAPPASISHVCKGKRKHAGKLPDGTKLKWTFYEGHLSN